MDRLNVLRVLVTVAAVVALGWTLLVPWWAYRVDADLAAAYESWKGIEFDEPLYMGNEVGMVPVWDIDQYASRQWLVFNLVQIGGIVCAWGWALAAIRERARIADEFPVGVTVTATFSGNSMS